MLGSRDTLGEALKLVERAANCLDRFRLRGLEKVNREWELMATTHNLLKQQAYPKE